MNCYQFLVRFTSNRSTLYPIRRSVVIEDTLASADVTVQEIARLGKELSELGRITTLTDERNEKLKTIKDLLAVEKEEEAKGSEDADMKMMIVEERTECEKQLAELEEEIIRRMTPKDEADERGVILEVRAGTGS
jgi:peptide chain release factor 1